MSGMAEAGAAAVDWRKVRRVHLIGVAGTGMGSFAGMLKAAGYEVTGSDENVYPPMSTQLERWGIEAMQGYRPENLDRAVEASEFDDAHRLAAGMVVFALVVLLALYRVNRRPRDEAGGGR